MSPLIVHTTIDPKFVKKYCASYSLLNALHSQYNSRCFLSHILQGLFQCIKSRDSPVGIALGYGLDRRCSRVRFPAGAGDFSLHHSVQNGSGAHSASYPMGTRVSFPGGKTAGS
jgi:hypothetical protein